MAKQRADGRIQVSVVIDRKCKYYYGKTLKEAQTKKQKYLESLRNAPKIDESLTFGQWLALWLRGAKSSLTLNTFESYTMELRRYILPNMAKIRLVEPLNVSLPNS